MESNTYLEELKNALKDKPCKIEKHSNVMEITFEKEEDANWFESILNIIKKKLQCAV